MQEIIKEHPYSTNTAEKHMLQHVCVGYPEETIADYLAKIKKCPAPEESFSYVYVVDQNGILIGAVSMRKLLKSDSSKKLSELTDKGKEIVNVHLHTDRETAARLAIHHELKALPVIDKSGKLMGVLMSHTILKILHEENTEDLLRAAGYRRDHKGAFIDVLKARALMLIKVRIPWLIVGLLGGMFATSIVSKFESHLKEYVILAFFMPVIVYMASAVGTQTGSLYLRLYDLGEFKLKSYLMREIQVVSGIGLICSVLIFGYTLLFFNDFKMAKIMAITIFSTTFISIFVATLIPTIISKLKKDPAVGSGPFATVIQDILSLVTYFLIAETLL